MRRTGAVATTLLTVALLSSSGSRGQTGGEEKRATNTVTCAFSNPGYSGWCRATEPLAAGVSPRGVCRGVLGCLNDARCVKTYCNATTIRGGWRLESVQTGSKAKS